MSRREPRYPTAQHLIGVGSFHPTRNAPLFTAHVQSESIRKEVHARSARISRAASDTRPAGG